MARPRNKTDLEKKMEAVFDNDLAAAAYNQGLIAGMAAVGHMFLAASLTPHMLRAILRGEMPKVDEKEI